MAVRSLRKAPFMAARRLKLDDATSWLLVVVLSPAPMLEARRHMRLVIADNRFFQSAGSNAAKFIVPRCLRLHLLAAASAAKESYSCSTAFEVMSAPALLKNGLGLWRNQAAAVHVQVQAKSRLQFSPVLLAKRTCVAPGIINGRPGSV